MEKTAQTPRPQWQIWCTSLLLGGLFALAICLAFLLICSIGIGNGLLDSESMYQYTIVGCVVGCFIGGTFAVMRCQSRTLMVGLGVGLVFFLYLLLFGTICYQNISMADGGIGLLCGGLSGGAAAGILARKPSRKRKRR